MPSVGLSVLKLNCGKTADWICMPSGMVSGVGGGMAVLDEGPHSPRGRGWLGSFSPFV